MCSDFPSAESIPCPTLPVEAGEAYFRYCPEDLKPRLAKAIVRFGNMYGVDVESPTVLHYADM